MFTANSVMQQQLIQDITSGVLDVVVYRGEVTVVSQQTRKFFIPAKWHSKKKTFIHNGKYPSIFAACASLIESGLLVDCGITAGGFKLFTLKGHESKLIELTGLALGADTKVDLRGFKAQLPEVNRRLAVAGCRVELERTVKAYKVVMHNGVELDNPYLPDVYNIRDWSMSDFMGKVIKILADNKIRYPKTKVKTV